MNDEPTRLVDEDPGFARLVAASRADVPSRVEVDRKVSLAKRVVSASRWRSWHWWTVGAGVVGLSVVGALTVTNSETTGGSRAASVPPVVETDLTERHSGRATAIDSSVSTPSAVLSPPSIEPSLPDAPLGSTVGASPSGAGAPSRSVQVLPSTLPPKDPPSTRSSLTTTANTTVADARRREGAPGPARTTTQRPAHSAAEGAGAESATSTFDEELELLSAARGGLDAKDVAACLRAVTRYERRFPAGVFAEEIYVIRIDALAMGGERTRARALAERFLTAHPTSAYVARVHSIAERCRD